MSVRLKIWVSFNDDKTPKYEIMTEDGQKLWDTTDTDIIEMIMQFASSLRYRRK